MDIKLLRLEEGIFWSFLWIVIILVLGNRSFWVAFKSGFTVLFWWIVISFLMFFSCKYFNWCI